MDEATVTFIALFAAIAAAAGFNALRGEDRDVGEASRQNRRRRLSRRIY